METIQIQEKEHWIRAQKCQQKTVYLEPKKRKQQSGGQWKDPP